MKAKSTASEPPVVTMMSSGREADLVLFVVGDQLLAQRAVTVAGTVFEDRAVDLFQGIKSDLRGWQIGLSDVQMVYLDTPGACGLGQWNKFANRGRPASARRVGEMTGM